MEKVLFEINVRLKEIIEVKGGHSNVVMISFDGTARGPYFEGKTIGESVDTQKIPAGKEAFLSARYMLEGRDRSGQECRIFIENNGSSAEGFVPWIVTNSRELAFLETAALSAEVEGCEGGVRIRIMESPDYIEGGSASDRT